MSDAGGVSQTGQGAPRSDLLARDRAARALAQREFSIPLMVEAGAGTGKTTTLTARILAWCLGPGWERTAARLEERAAARPIPVASDRPGAEDVAAETLRRVVAITFTEAAAAEMARRVAGTLAGLAAGSRPAWLDLAEAPAGAAAHGGGVVALRAAALLGNLDRLAVRTIHAFCRSLLTAHPLEAGLHPELEVDADGAAVEETAHEVVETRLRAGYGDPGDERLLALAARGLGPRELALAVVDLIRAGTRAADLADEPYSADRVEAARDELARARDALETAIGGCLDGLPGVPKTTATLASLRATGELLAGLAAPAATPPPAPWETAARLAAGLREIWDATAERLGDWRKETFAKREAAALGERCPEVTRAAAGLAAAVDQLTGLDPELLALARPVLGELLGETRRRLREQGIATFDDLLIETRDLLASRPDVAGRVRRRIDQLLVDEFQDTDYLQCELVEILTLAGAPEERPGLFVVGDPKQSIYGWRSADLAAYDAFRARLEAAGGEIVTLSQNFRSVPAILDEVERAIAPVMVAETGLQPPFEPLAVCTELAGATGFSSGRWAAVEHWVSWRDDAGEASGGAATRADEATALEAEALAADLASLHREGGVAWGETALLLRSLGDLDVYLEALRRYGVPFAVAGDRQYFRRREVIDAAALVRAVVDPGDHLALVSFLRSPVVGMPDAALLPLWRRDFPRRVTELTSPDPERLAALGEVVAAAAAEIPAGIPGLERVAGWELALGAALAALAELRELFRTAPVDRFVERLRTRLPVEALAAARYLGRYRLANLERFFRRLVASADDAGGDVGAVLRALRRAVSEGRDEEEGRPQTDEADAVQVMTIHKAKGLDFGHVYLGQLHKQAPPESLATIELGRLDGRVEYSLFGAATLGFSRVREARRRIEAAERVRTLYVAMTRAKQRLVLAGKWGVQLEEKAFAVEAARCHLDLLGPRFAAGPRPQELWLERRERLDGGGVRWVFPAFLAGGGVGEGAGRTGEPPGLPSPEAVAADRRRLARLAEEAARRMARPISTPASEEAHRLLREVQAEEFEEGASRPPPAFGPEREVAMAVGSAVHRLLETLDLAGDVGTEIAGLRRDPERLRTLAALLLPPGSAEVMVTAARERTEEILARLPGSRVLARLAEIAPRVVARELAVLDLPSLPRSLSHPGGERGTPPPSPRSAEAMSGETGPVGFVAGSIDLVYLDPDGAPVVVDFKTDRVEAADVAERTAAYGPQMATYARAVQEALGLPAPPRTELWFLWPDTVITHSI